MIEQPRRDGGEALAPLEGVAEIHRLGAVVKQPCRNIRQGVGEAHRAVSLTAEQPGKGLRGITACKQVRRDGGEFRTYGKGVVKGNRAGTAAEQAAGNRDQDLAGAEAVIKGGCFSTAAEHPRWQRGQLIVILEAPVKADRAGALRE